MKTCLFFAFFIIGCEIPNGDVSNPAPTPTVAETPKQNPVVEAPKPNPVVETPKPKPNSTDTLPILLNAVSNTKCAQYFWKDRGKAPLAYIQGVSLMYAKSICQPTRDDVKIISTARQLPEVLWDYVDALSWYNSNFNAIGLNNDVSGKDTLRNSYTLLIGLGMRESSGRYCLGRDMSANYSTGETAEAGLFQASWGAHTTNPVLLRLHKKYQEGSQKCFLDIFSKGVSCSVNEAKNWGTGEGVNWQKMTKDCPSYAVEYSAVLLRTSGGTQGEFGPLRRKEVELNLQCNDMLKQVESVIKENPKICDIF